MRLRAVIAAVIGGCVGAGFVAACDVDGVTPDCSDGKCGPNTVDASDSSTNVVPEGSTDTGVHDAAPADARDADARG